MREGGKAAVKWCYSLLSWKGGVTQERESEWCCLPYDLSPSRGELSTRWRRSSRGEERARKRS